MSLTLSAPVKIFALLAMLAAFAGGGAMMFMSPAEVETSAALIETPALAKKVASKANADAAAKAAGTVAAAPKPKAKVPAKAKLATPPAPAAKPKPAPKPAPKPVAANGLPTSLVQALGRYDVVVVALWGTGGKIDGMSRDEAAAGAAAAGVGFVSINVIEQSKQAEALTLKVGGVLRAPGVLLYTRPDALANRLDGFRDRDVVAQAALDALR